MRTPFSRIDPQDYEKEAESHRGILLEKYERCNFCNSRLVFSHDLNLMHLQVVETGRCPGCGVSLIPKKYTIQ